MSAIAVTANDLFPVTSPSKTLMVGRNRANTTTAAISGTWSGTTPTAFESSIGGAYAALTGVSIGAGTWSGTTPPYADGDYTLNVRFTNEIATTIAVRMVIGAGILKVGDSTVISGPTGQATDDTPTIWSLTYATSPQSWQHPAGNYQWGWLDEQLAAYLGCPVFGVNSGSSGTKIEDWAPGQGPYLAMQANLVDAKVINGYELALCHVTVNNFQAGATAAAATIKTRLETLAAGIAADVPGAPPLFVAMWADRDPTGGYGGSTEGAYRTDGETVRQGLIDAYTAGTIKRGANITGELYVDHVHQSTTAHCQTIGRRWFAALKAGFYNDGSITAPRPASITIDSTKKIVRVTFNQDLGNSAGSAVVGFRVMDGGTAVTITSQVVTGRVVTLTLPSAIVGVCTVSWASSEDAINQTMPMSASVTLPDTTAGASTVQQPAEPFFNSAVTDFVPSSGVSRTRLQLGM